MSEWNEVRLGDLCAFVSRGITPQYVDEGIPVINQKCIRNNKVDLSLCKHTNTAQKIKNEKYVQYGDILVNSTGTGTLGRVAIYKHHVDKISADGHVTILHTNQNADPIYLGYYLHSVEPLIENLGRGTTNQLELSPSDLKRIKIVLPDLHTQKRIADVLSGYDDLIENNNRRIEILEKAAQELYKEWFVRFRFPGHETTKFENGLPEGWVYDRLSSIMSFGAGKERPSSGSIYPVYGGNGILDYCDSYNNKNAIIIGRVGAYCGSVYYEPEKCWISDNALYAISKNNAIYFNYYMLKHSNLNARQVGTGQPLITQGLLNKIKTIIPSNPLIHKYNSLVSDLLLQQRYLKQKNESLAKQRDLLLPRLMSGKLEV